MAIKIAILEKDGVEFDIANEHRYNALDQDFSDELFNSTNTKDAILESTALAGGAIRIPDFGGYNGNAGVGKWLERFASIASNDGPLIIPDIRKIVTLSLTAGTASTGTVTIYKSPRGTPVVLTTISLSNSRTYSISNLNVSLSPGDEVGYQVTSGSISKPFLTMETQKIII